MYKCVVYICEQCVCMMNKVQVALTVLLQETNGLSTILQPGDIFVLDLGFRDFVRLILIIHILIHEQ